MHARRIPRHTGRQPWALAGFVCLVLRVLYSVLGALVAARITLDPDLIRSNRLTERLMEPSQGSLYALLGVWERFDTLWYLHIAQHGYDRPDAVVFFPLYPLLLRLASVVPVPPLAVALLASTIATFFLFWGLQELLRLDLPAEAATRALVLYAVWPASFIFFCGYADSLVLALSIWSIYFARRGWWLWSGLAGGLGALTKAVGFLVIAPQAFLAWRSRKWQALAVAGTLLGCAAFPLWLMLSGRLLPWEAYPRYWYTYPAWPWVTLWNILRAVWASESRFLVVHLVLLLLTAGLALSRRIRPEYTLYVSVALFFVLTKNAVLAQQQWARWVLILFPAPVHLALLGGRGLLFPAAAASLWLLNVILLLLFLHWSLAV